MRYKLLGASGLRVSELALGTMTFGEEWGWGASKEESRAMFEAYAGAGGNFIDTANRYTEGTSERLVGELIAPDREHWVVATKYTLWMRRDDPNFSGNHRKNLIQALDASLERLGTEYVDLYWVHVWDFTTPIDEVMRALDDVVRAGKVLYVACEYAGRASRMDAVRGTPAPLQPDRPDRRARPPPDGAGAGPGGDAVERPRRRRPDRKVQPRREAGRGPGA
jgi:aryl-alcohol dehydrogenase-like predicted oxidoreductase